MFHVDSPTFHVSFVSYLALSGQIGRGSSQWSIPHLSRLHRATTSTERAFARAEGCDHEDTYTVDHGRYGEPTAYACEYCDVVFGPDTAKYESIMMAEVESAERAAEKALYGE